MSSVSTADVIRNANPDVAYENQVFTEPFDIEAQALQIETANKVGWPLADAFIIIQGLNATFAQLGTLHAFGAVDALKGLRVVANLDAQINDLLGLLVESEGRDPEAVQGALKEYAVKYKAIATKYFPKPSAEVESPSTAPQN